LVEASNEEGLHGLGAEIHTLAPPVRDVVDVEHLVEYLALVASPLRRLRVAPDGLGEINTGGLAVKATDGARDIRFVRTSHFAIVVRKRLGGGAAVAVRALVSVRRFLVGCRLHRLLLPGQLSLAHNRGIRRH
jgi:hypothetical protein